MDIGLNLEQVLTVEGPRVLPEDMDAGVAIGTFLQELRRLPDVQQAAGSYSLPGKGFNWNGASIRKASDEPADAIRGVATYVDTAFASLYGLELIAGRSFGEVTISDAEDATWMVITNETTIRSLGFPAPTEAIDQLLDIGGYEAQIIGVYKDFNWSSAHTEQQNIVFGPTTQGRNISLRLSTTDLARTITEVKTLYNQLFPGNVFNYAFLDEVFDQQYKNDIRFAKLFSLFTGLAIFIACLGLFALAAYTAQQRQKEIGVRKILGASVENVVTLLSADFLKLIVIGYIVAAPLAWYVMNEWLQDFVYKVEIGISVFIVAGLAAVILGLATVSWQSIKAAIANPVDSLRDE
jgi:putative ABC transport system permease protein